MTTLHTIGHSTRSADEFVELLTTYGIDLLVDVRQFPASRRFPHFNSDALSGLLLQHHIGYVHEVDLGGRRRASADSPNTYWKNVSFRSYADYMASPAFQTALERLMTHAERHNMAIMCAEAVPWRCHRWLISDALVVHGFEVIHIIDLKHSQPHVLNPSAQIDPQQVLTYPAAQLRLLD